jgi:hypothetical protein
MNIPLKWDVCLLFLIIFSMKKWNFSGRALSKEKRKDHAE